jgi:hypothetical protein
MGNGHLHERELIIELVAPHAANAGGKEQLDQAEGSTEKEDLKVLCSSSRHLLEG